MKKILFIAIVAAFTFSSCKEGKFGGDFEVEGVALQNMCGTWMCTVECNAAYWFPQYLIGEEFFETVAEIAADPECAKEGYGFYNPDVNGDGVVDLQDLESDDYAKRWKDEYGVGTIMFQTYNTADNNKTDMWLEDNKFWETKTRCIVNSSKMTFDCTGQLSSDLAYEVEMDGGKTETINSAYGTEEGVVILGGKILKGAAHAPVSGIQTDSIIFYIKYNDDYAEDIYYRVSGYRATGYTEDEETFE